MAEISLELRIQVLLPINLVDKGVETDTVFAVLG